MPGGFKQRQAHWIVKLSRHKAGSEKSLAIEKETASDEDRRFVVAWLSRPKHLLTLAILAAIVCAVWHVYSKRSEGSLTIPVPADLDRLDPQLRAYLQEKLDWVREKPLDANRQATLGIVYAANGLWERARDAFRNVEQLDPNQPLASMYVAVATQELGDLAEAVRMYRDLTLRFPDFAPGYYRLGDASLRAGEVARAEAAFGRLIALAPKEWRGYAGLGDVKLRVGQYAEAAQELQKAIQLAPDEKMAHHLLGLACRGLGRKQDAEMELSRGLNAEHYPMPDAWSVTAAQHMNLLPDLFDMAKHYSTTGNPAKAVEILERALKFHPGDKGVMNHLAAAYNQSGQPQKARELLLKAIQNDDRNLPAYIGLSYSCAALGASNDAIAYASRAIELGTNNPQSYMAKANALLAAERDTEALAALESAYRCDPRSADIQMTMGDVCLQNLDRPKEAMNHYQSAVELDPALVSGYVRIAQLNIERGEYNQAHSAIQTIQRIAPGNPALAVLEDRLSKLEPVIRNRD